MRLAGRGGKTGPKQIAETAGVNGVKAVPARRRKKNFDPVPYLLIAPATLFLVIFLAIPIVQTLVVALQNRDGVFTFDNIETMVHDVNFGDALRNTLLLIVIIVPLQVALALLMALIINSGVRFAGLFLYIWTIPLAISELAAGIIWLAIFTERGYINSLLSQIGIVDTPVPFLSYENPTGLFTAIVVAEVWRATSLVMVILVAGLQMIPGAYTEAAEVFGASAWQRLRYIILPLLRPSLQVGLILRTILAFQMFAVVVALTGHTVPVLAGESYYWYYSYRDTGVAASYAGLILLLSILNCYIYIRTLRVRPERLAGN